MPKFHHHRNSALKILHLNTFDITGGAAKAANRLHNGLLEHDVQSRMLVQVKKGDDWRITQPSKKIVRSTSLFRPYLDSLPLLLYPHRSTDFFSTATIPDFLISELLSISPDIIHLHWINYGFVRLETLKRLHCPIVWTFHDMWPFTGGCHVDKNCGRYVQRCGHCPHLGSKRQRDLSQLILNRKHHAFADINLTVVTPSTWLASCVRKSFLHKMRPINVIPNGINLKIFKPVSKLIARQIYNLPKNKKIILFGSINPTCDPNKGFHLIQKALLLLKQNCIDYEIEIAIFGVTVPKKEPDLGFKCHYFGQLLDEISIATLYSAADVMVVPSLQEAFGQTASEALACGCPVVAFKTTGLIDIINHRINGYLSSPFKTDDLAKGIQWVLSDEKRHEELRTAACQKAIREYDIQKIAKQYRNLYQRILTDEW